MNQGINRAIGTLTDSLCALLLMVLVAPATAQTSEGRRPFDPARAVSFLSANTIMVRLGQPPSDEQIKALAKIGAPVSLNIAANVRPEDALRTYCGGSFTNTYLQIVLESNPGFRLITDPNPRTIQVTPCPKFQSRPSTIIAQGDTLDAILARTMGINKSQPINSCGGPPGSPACLANAGEATSKLNGNTAVVNVLVVSLQANCFSSSGCMRSGLSQTSSFNSQLRVDRDQRRGLRSLASA